MPLIVRIVPRILPLYLKRLGGMAERGTRMPVCVDRQRHRPWALVPLPAVDRPADLLQKLLMEEPITSLFEEECSPFVMTFNLQLSDPDRIHQRDL
jgi:hypothetical protein